MTAEPTRGRAVVVVVSTQAAADPELDRTGPVIADWLREHGFTTSEPIIVPDGGAITETVTAELLADARVVITTGGTGVTPTDRTPEAVASLIDLELPGITEEIRRRGLAGAGPDRAAHPRGRRGHERRLPARHPARIARWGVRRARRARRSTHPRGRPGARRGPRPAERPREHHRVRRTGRARRRRRPRHQCRRGRSRGRHRA
ncbi:molybdopterin-binding protein [Curtobacterium flaccumfaciens]|nr:molybdopterin-binding protein [Curtobacterium flaccumfaciens]